MLRPPPSAKLPQHALRAFAYGGVAVGQHLGKEVACAFLVTQVDVGTGQLEALRPAHHCRGRDGHAICTGGGACSLLVPCRLAPRRGRSGGRGRWLCSRSRSGLPEQRSTGTERIREGRPLGRGYGFAERSRRGIPTSPFEPPADQTRQQQYGGELHRQHIGAEQGYAHLLEHLLFRESKYLGQAEAIYAWQRLGATFGSDANAETSPTHTAYKLDIPNIDDAKLGESFKLLSGMIREPTLSAKGLSEDLPIVLAEKREQAAAAAQATP